MCDIEGGAPYGEYGEMLHSVPPGADCSLNMEDSYGDGWNGAVWSAAGWTSMSFSLAYGDVSTEFFTAPAVAIAAPLPPPPFTAPSPSPPPAPCSSWDESWPEAAVSVSEGGYQWEVSWTLSCVGMCDVIQGGAPYDGMHSVPPGAECTLEMLDSYGDGWNDAIWWSGFSDEAGYTLETGSFETISFAANPAPSASLTSPAEHGQCIVNGPCVCSSNYPGDSCNADPVDPSWGSQYGNYETCHVEFTQPMVLNVSLFGVEGNSYSCPYDKLEVNGVTYCGDQPARPGAAAPCCSWRGRSPPPWSGPRRGGWWVWV
jgi:hypothetical protein